MFISKIMRGGGGRKGFLWLWHWSYRATITHAGNLIFQDIPAHPPASGECFAPAYIFWFPYYAVIILNQNFLAFLLFLPHLMKKSVSKRLGRGLGAGRSQLTTPSFKSIVPGLFAYFVQWLFKYKICKLFWVKTRTRIPLAALSGVMDIRLLNNSLSCEKSVHFYTYFPLGQKVRSFNACCKIMRRIWLKLTLRCDCGSETLCVLPRGLCSIQ